MRTVSYLQFLLVIFRILIPCEFGIFTINKGWDLGFFPLLNFRASKDDEKTFITFDFYSVESRKEKGDFWRVISTFCTLSY